MRVVLDQCQIYRSQTIVNQIKIRKTEIKASLKSEKSEIGKA